LLKILIVTSFMKGIIGAIAGDVIGSAYEFHPTRQYDFNLFTASSDFTDDTVLTMANAKWLLEDGHHKASTLRNIMLDFCRRYPGRGYGGRFASWIVSDNPQPYGSFGNGSAMRVSPIGYYAQSVEQALQLAETSAAVTHNHPEGIKGAQAIAAAIYWARNGYSKQAIRDNIVQSFGYKLDRSLNEIRLNYGFDETCQKTVPEALTCYIEGKDYEDVIRLAVSLAGDADTLAAIAGGIASVTDDVPEDVAQKVLDLLPQEFCEILEQFNSLVDKIDIHS